MGQIFIITKTKKSVIKIRKYSTSICMTILSHMFIIHLKQSLDDLTSVINKYSEKTSLAFLSAKGLKNPTLADYNIWFNHLAFAPKSVYYV